MKKKIIFIFTTIFVFIFMFVGLIPSTENVEAENPKVEALGATYQVTKNLINNEIGYGVYHIKDHALSSATNLNNYDSCGPKDTLVGQQVNVLGIPSNEAVRIVNWTYNTPDGWTKQTVRKLAENFEYHNPGWKVIAGINGDFFDINGNQALPYPGNGYVVSNGNVLKPYGSASAVGFKNDGSSYQLVGGQKIECGPLKLQIVDENDKILKEFDVNKINDTVENNEVGVWFTYNVMNDGIRNEVPVTVHGDNIFLCEAPYRCLPMAKQSVYAKGILQHYTDEKTLLLGQFAVETTNSEVVSYIEQGSTIRLQQNLIGAYADCDNVTGAGIQLLKDGVAVGDSDLNRHPRTCVGIKADGTVIFFTVDGRQFDSNMYGMSSAEMAAALLNYGCVEAYNLDGGGSTTIITRNAYGDFDVHNSPSDGGERSDSNALLVVVPEISLDVVSVNDTYMSLEYRPNTEVKATNIQLTLNGETRELNTTNYIWSNLTPQTQYELDYTYDIEYKNSVLKGQNGKLYFTTGKNLPKFSSFYYEETETEYLIHFGLTDTNKTLTSPRIKYTVNGSSKSISISTSTKSPVSIAKVDGIDPSSFVFSGRYNIASSIAENVRFDIPIYKFASHTITYDLKDGVQNNSNVASYDSSSLPVTLAEPTKYGHYFMGWYDDESNRVLSINNTDAGDVHLTAKWQAKPYTLTIDDGHGNINKITYKFGEQIATPSNPANVEGYEFAGWDKEIPSIMPNNDLIITAKWTKIETPVDNQEENGCGCGCGCGCNSAIVMTLTGILAIGLIVIRKKH